MKKMVLVVMVLVLGGCAAAPVVAPPQVVGNPAPDSKFSKVQLGMTQNQVESLIGKSKDCPISYDSSTFSMVTSCTYQNEGVLVFRFNSGSTLYRIMVDATSGEYQAEKK